MNVIDCYLAAPQPTLGHYKEDRLNNPMLIMFLQFQPKGHRKPCNEVESLNRGKGELESRTFQFQLQRINIFSNYIIDHMKYIT